MLLTLLALGLFLLLLLLPPREVGVLPSPLEGEISRKNKKQCHPSACQ